MLNLSPFAKNKPVPMAAKFEKIQSNLANKSYDLSGMAARRVENAKPAENTNKFGL